MRVFFRLIWRLTLAFLMIGIANSAISVWRDIQYTKTSVNWQMVDGRLVRVVDLDTIPWRGKHKPDEIVEYEFVVGAKTYSGRTISFSRRSAWYHDEVRDLVTSLASKRSVPVFFNPSFPKEAVLQPGGSNEANIWFFVGQMFATAAIAALILRDLKARRHD